MPVTEVGVDPEHDQEDVGEVVHEYHDGTDGVDIDEDAEHDQEGGHAVVEKELVVLLVVEVDK